MKTEVPHNKVNILRMTETEKAELKRKIFTSIDKHKLRVRRIKYALGIAASLVVLVGFSIYFDTISPKKTVTDLDSLPELIDNKNLEYIQLILGAGENLYITDDITTIKYSSTGEKVTIGATKQIDQNVSKSNAIVYNTLLVPYGKRSKIELSDGSVVWLNSGSKLLFPASFSEQRREVYLEGEAIFEVSHSKDHPFIVNSGDKEIEVLGTVFGVSNYLDENLFNTVLKSGSVQISYNIKLSKNTSDKIKITPGTMTSFNKDSKSITSEKVNVANYFSWRDGVLIFQNNDLQFIMKKISRYYNVDIKIIDETLANETFSGYLDLNENINKVIQSVKQSTNMEYTLQDNTIIISK